MEATKVDPDLRDNDWKKIERALRELRCAYDPEETKSLTVPVSMRQESISLAIKALSNLYVVDQALWERDYALAQLHEIGKELGSNMDDIVELLKTKEESK